MVLFDKRVVGHSINAVAGKDFRADGLAFFQIVCVKNGDVLVPLDAGFPRECREVVDGACIALEHAVDDDVVRGQNTGKTQIKESVSIVAVHAEQLE